MAQLRRDYEKFISLGAEIIAIGPEKDAEFGHFWSNEKMPFIGIPDPEHKIADLYGQENRVLSLGRMPALFIIDQQGIIRYVHRAKAMWDIPKNKEILEVLATLQKR
jgi:peroxiredoxin